MNKQCSSTFDMNEAVEESDGFDGEEVGHVLHANFKRVPVVQLQVGVNRETQVLLNLLTQFVQQVLQESDARNKRTRSTNSHTRNTEVRDDVNDNLFHVYKSIQSKCCDIYTP